MSNELEVFTNDHFENTPAPIEKGEATVIREEPTEPKVEEIKVHRVEEEDEEDEVVHTKLEEGEEASAPKKKGGFQKRIDKLNAKLAQVEQELAQYRQPPQAQIKPEVEKKLNPDDFEDFTDYIEAVAERKAMQKLRDRDAEVSAARELEKQSEKKKTWIQKVEASREKYADLDEVLDSDAPLTPAMAEIITESANGVDLAYWLGSNPQEAERIAALPPLQQAKELGRIEDRLAEKPKAPVKTSKAPTPITPVKGKVAPSAELSAESDYDAWSKKQFGL